MLGTMQDYPLTIGMLFRHGAAVHGDSEVVTFEGDGSRRATFREVAARTEQLAAALQRLGIEPGDRVGTFAWNIQEHLEAYFAVPASARCCTRSTSGSSPSSSTYVVNHAADRIVLVDGSLIPLLAKVAPELTTVETYVVIGDGDTGTLAEAAPNVEILRLRRAPRRRAARYRVARRRRTRRRGDVLHERHDRQPEGCRLHAPVDVPALVRRGLRRLRSSPTATASSRSCRCSTPTRGACRTPRGCAAPTSSCRTASCRPSRSRASSTRRSRPSRARSRRSGPTCCATARIPTLDLSSLAHDRLRRVRGAAVVDGGVPDQRTASG